MDSKLGFSVIALVLLGGGCARPAAGGAALPALQPNHRGSSAASAEQVLYSFTGGDDGGNAATGLVLDAAGNLYGTTVVGGKYACGTVFKLAPQASPPWPESVLYNFGCYADGKSPHGGVTFDGKSNLYGTTVAGGSGGYCTSDGCGIVYQLTPTAENVLHNFSGGNDGFGPGGGVAFDGTGDVYGTTPDGGSYSQGIVYELVRSKKQWRENVIHTFTGGYDGGVGSLGLLLIDKAGYVYGVAEEGGAHGAGTIFELSRTSKNGWKFMMRYAFKGTPDGASPYGGLVSDADGNLFGTTYYGGGSGLGAVFELARLGTNKYHERVLYSFRGGEDGSSSTSTLVLRSSNELYGTTSAGGGSCDCGTIFQLNVKTGKERVLHRFGSGSDGAFPYYGLTQDTHGNFYGTTVAGGAYGQGAVFKFTP